MLQKTVMYVKSVDIVTVIEPKVMKVNSLIFFNYEGINY